MNVKQDIVDREYTDAGFDVLLDDLLTELKARNYRVTRINHIDNIYDRVEAGIDVAVEFKRYKIVEFCNLNSCSELISADLQAGVFMPVKFIVYQKLDDLASHVAFLKPTAFARLFESDELTRVAVQLENDMNHVLEELDW